MTYKAMRTDNNSYIIPEMMEFWPEEVWAGLEQGEAYSVSKIKSVLAKDGLVPWAASLERKAILAVIEQTFAVCALKQFEVNEYIEYVKIGIGEKKAHVQALEKAQDIGNDAHELIDAFLKGGETKKKIEREAPWLVYRAFLEFKALNELKVKETERSVWHKELRYAGTVDCIAETKEGIFIIDWKSSKAIYTDMWLQVVAYREAAVSMGLAPKAAGCMLVRLPKEEAEVPKLVKKYGVPFETKVLDSARYADYHGAWLAAIALHHNLKKIELGEKKNGKSGRES